MNSAPKLNTFQHLIGEHQTFLEANRQAVLVIGASCLNNRKNRNRQKSLRTCHTLGIFEKQ